MKLWQAGAFANGITAVGYFLICYSIARGLVRAGQFGSNRLGTATALIFFTCGVHHGAETVHTLLPAFGVTFPSAVAMRRSFDWESIIWDLVTAAVGCYYWTQRRAYGRLMEGGMMFDDHRARRREALEINDGIVQGIVAAQMATELKSPEELDAALAGALRAARQLVARLLAESSSGGTPNAGDFVRSVPASLRDP